MLNSMKQSQFRGFVFGALPNHGKQDMSEFFITGKICYNFSNNNNNNNILESGNNFLQTLYSYKLLWSFGHV